MKKIYLLLWVSILCLSCGTGKNEVYSLKTGSTEDIQNISYFSPVYSFKDNESANSRRGYYLVKNINHKTDSIFQVDPKFKISHKITPQNTEVSLEILRELNSLLEQVIETGTIQSVEIPHHVRSVIKEDAERYAMAVFITPEMSRKHTTFRSITYHLLILDSKLDRISFYGSSTPKSTKWYTKGFIRSIEEIYMRIN